MFKKEITLEMLQNDPSITPDDVFGGGEDDEKMKLLDLLEKSELEAIRNAPVESLPPPEGIGAKQIAEARGNFIDNKLYSYGELIKMLNKQGDKAKVPTFFAPVDKLIEGGFQGGELVILSGPTKCGKTSACQTFSYLQGMNGFPSLWFTLEMSWQELVKKFMEMDRAGSQTLVHSDLPIFMPIDNTKLSLEWMEKQIKKAQEQSYVSCVYVDHLHFLLPLKDFNQNVSFLVGGIVREIKKIAVRCQIPIFLIAHTKKLDVKEDPDINSVRDSSFIAQESDFTFLVWRQRVGKPSKKNLDTRTPDEEDNVIYEDYSWLSLEANRRTGETKKIPVGFLDGRFYPYNDYQSLLFLRENRKLRHEQQNHG